MDGEPSGSNQSDATASRRRIRRPKRKVITTTTNEPTSSRNDTGWTKLERTMLLLALKQYGVKDMKMLSKTLNSKSEKQIRRFLRMCRRKSLQQHPDDVETAVLDVWLKVVEDATPKTAHRSGPNSLLPLSFLAISLFEDHPDPSECGGVDFRRAYESLFLLMSGLPLKTLNKPTAMLVRDTFLQLDTTCTETTHIGIANFLQQYETKSYNLSTLSKKRNAKVESVAALDKTSAMDNLMKLPGFNPLCVPLNILKKPDANNIH